MRVTDITLKLLGLIESIAKLQSVIAGTDEKRRERIALYAEAVAGTLARATDAFERLDKDPDDSDATRNAVREFGRLRGYVENITDALDGQIDGRRLAGIERRLQRIASEGLIVESLERADPRRIARLAAAEGWFRALADGARAR